MGDLLKELKSAVTVDFETEPIRSRPDYPPKPCGVGILQDGKAEYITDWAAMKRRLTALWTSDLPLLFHNANFDLEVAREHFGLSLPECSRVHDTLPMLFLRNPYAETYSLKPSSEIILGMKPEERDAVVDWLVEHQPVEGVKLTKTPGSGRSKKTTKRPVKFEYAGAWICKAPVSLVGPYCIGDVKRTYKLALKAGAHLEKMEMVDAYRREIALIPVVLDMEREGVRVDVGRLKRDAALYAKIIERLDDWLRKKLKAPDLNVDSGAELAHALMEASYAKAEDLGTTPTGQVCTAKESLQGAINDPQIAATIRYRGAVATCLSTFIGPWTGLSQKTGRIYARWNAIRQSHQAGMVGARTGRLSCTPNLMNIPKVFTPLFREHIKMPAGASKGRKELSALRRSLPRAPLAGLPPPPKVRSYFLADDGHVLIDRDFSQQELRILAYFEDDVLAAAYRENADTDLHQKASEILGVPRSKGKTLNLSIIYGMGLGLLAERLGCSLDEAKALKAAYFKAFPSIKQFLKDVTFASRAGHPVNTWGGRKYYVEDPKFVRGHMQTFEYKLPNYLIQGSAADLTKACMIEAHREIPFARMRATVHDELLLSVPKERAEEAMMKLKEIMARPRLDVPMTSTGKIGPTWADMKECG